MIKFFIEGTPVAKERPRWSTHTGHMYTPAKTAKWESYVGWIAKQHRPAKPFEGAIGVNLTFRLKRPKSIKKDVVYAIGRSDLDNYVKAILDALHGSFFKNDNQIVELSCIKAYYDNPGVSIVIWPIDN